MGSDLVFLCLVVGIIISEFANQTSYFMRFFHLRRRATIQTVGPATLHGQANARATGRAIAV